MNALARGRSPGPPVSTFATEVSTCADQGVVGYNALVPGPFSAHHSSPVELQAQIAAERSADPFLVYRDAADAQQIVRLDAGAARVRVGRDPMCELCLGGDARVSRLHAELERHGDVWVLADHGLSRNGSFVNEQRVDGQRVLRDGDVLRFGATHVLYRAPEDREVAATSVATTDAPLTLTPTQRGVLVALCRPLRDADGLFAMPASNQQIADEVALSVDRVKAHLGALYELVGVADLPQQHKRARLAEIALRTGLVTRRELSA
jgi:pSer/pThr/pTyr-binding forkhead associated (FHA) protein